MSSEAAQNVLHDSSILIGPAYSIEERMQNKAHAASTGTSQKKE
jgi:hypothetical protein